MPFFPILNNLASILATQFGKGGGYDPFSQAMWDWGDRINPVTGEQQWHNGIDLPVPYGTPVFSPIDGVVTVKHHYTGDPETDPSGNYVITRVQDKEFPELYEIAYCHFSDFGPGIENGAPVKRGQIVGYIGSTGRSTGAHLHFIVREGTSSGDKQDVNPLDYIAKKNILQGVGILGGFLVGVVGVWWWLSKH
jgi:murein DD-endopeptidase MepM/ murein hydrolase activator NlpD